MTRPLRRLKIGARLVTIPAGPLQANCHFVYDQELGTGFIVDPGGDEAQILRLIAEAAVALKGILLTHGHADHVAATARIRAATKAPVFGSAEAQTVLADPDKYVLFPGMPSFEGAPVDHLITADEQLDVGGLLVQAIMTPGHTRGSITYYAMEGLFCGDLLFRGSVGRTDLGGGSFDELAASVRRLVLTYPADTVVYPGHGSATTLARERESNPFLTDLGW